MLKRSKEPTLDPKSKDVAVIAAIKKREKKRAKQLRLGLKKTEQESSHNKIEPVSSISFPSTHGNDTATADTAPLDTTPKQKKGPDEVVTKVLDFAEQPIPTSKTTEKSTVLTESEIDGSAVISEASKKESDECEYDESDADLLKECGPIF